jgi:hypothetical protein
MCRAMMTIGKKKISHLPLLLFICSSDSFIYFALVQATRIAAGVFEKHGMRRIIVRLSHG